MTLLKDEIHLIIYYVAVIQKKRIYILDVEQMAPFFHQAAVILSNNHRVVISAFYMVNKNI